MPTSKNFYFSALIVSAICFVLLMRKGVSRRRNVLLLLIDLNCISASFILFLSDVFVGRFLAFEAMTHYFYHYIHCAFPLLFLLYAIELSGRWHAIKSQKMLILFVPISVFYLVLLTNPVTNFAFTVVNGKYHRGTGILVEYVCAVIYVALAIGQMIRYTKAIGKSKIIELIAFTGFSIVGVLIQFLFPEVCLELFFEAVGLSAIVGSVENYEQIVDQTTRLYNPDTFQRDTEQLRLAGTKHSIILFRICNYRVLSSSIGFEPMNRLFRGIGSWMKSNFRNRYSMYYLEHGLFAMIVYRKNVRTGEADQAMLQIKQALSAAHTISGIAIPIEADIFLIHMPEDAKSVEEAVELVEIIESPRSEGVRIFKEKDLAYYRRFLQVEDAVRRGLTNKNLKVYYQPIYDAQSGRFRSAEALARLEDEKLGFIPPDEFIHVAEKTGLIFDVGEKIFRLVCKDMHSQDFKRSGIEFVEINLSPVQCMKDKLCEEYQKIMEEFQIPPEQINLEITESTAEKSQAMFRKAYTELQQLGLTFALDDYGSGVSNLTSLIEMNYSIIKIDRSLLWNADNNPEGEMILSNIINMIHGLNLHIVAEGVETAQQEAYLTEHNVKYLQGFYYSKAVPFGEFIRFCKRFNG
ncbi:MAG: EAL domain-containing protein [Lachnospiraceae bacterium]|nr:EAL domain-containing protein [Lachnospiraceae bacterium]